MINLDVSRKDGVKIDAIMLRAMKVLPPGHITPLMLALDLTACHCNGNPLDLDELLNASTGQFIHDIVGICRHIDRETGKLGDCFSPRYSKRLKEGVDEDFNG